MDELAEGNLEVSGYSRHLLRALGGNFLEEGVESFFDEGLLDLCAIGHSDVARNWCTHGRESQLGKIRGLADREQTSFVDLDNKETPTHSVAPTILDGRPERVET